MSARLDIDGDDVVVSIDGWDRLWALQREVRVPLANVTGVGVVERKDLKGTWLRLWGTHWPGGTKAGRFFGKRGNEFWLLRDQRRAVVLETFGKWARVVVQTDDPETDAARVLAAR